MRCPGCDTDLGDYDQREAFICVQRGGDEYTESYWYCRTCQGYANETYHERFMGGDSVHASGPVPVGDMKALLAQIAACPKPNDKRCSCKTHRAMGD